MVIRFFDDKENILRFRDGDSGNLCELASLGIAVFAFLSRRLHFSSRILAASRWTHVESCSLCLGTESSLSDSVSNQSGEHRAKMSGEEFKRQRLMFECEDSCFLPVPFAVASSQNC